MKARNLLRFLAFFFFKEAVDGLVRRPAVFFHAEQETAMELDVFLRRVMQCDSERRLSQIPMPIAGLRQAICALQKMAQAFLLAGVTHEFRSCLFPVRVHNLSS